MSDAILEVRHLSKSFGTNEVLRDIDFDVRPGDVTSIIGASGSGKSTLLRCINLLETPTSGDVIYHGESVGTGKVNPNKYRAKVGMVFQSFNLFDNMTVLKNCMIGQMKVLKRSVAEAEANAMKYLERVGMAPYIKAKPRQISGGMKQRLLAAAALLGEPQILIMDEPTAGLDPKERVRLRQVLAQLAHDCIIIVATHVVSDVEHVASEILLLKEGQLVDQASPAALIEKYAPGGTLEDVYLAIFGEDEA